MYSTVDLIRRSVRLVLSVDERQVDGGGGAQQAVGFGLNIISVRRNANVESLNELHKKTHVSTGLWGISDRLCMHSEVEIFTDVFGMFVLPNKRTLWFLLQDTHD